MDDAVSTNVYANVLAIIPMDDELVNVNDLNVINELIAASLELLNTCLIILESKSVRRN